MSQAITDTLQRAGLTAIRLAREGDAHAAETIRAMQSRVADLEKAAMPEAKKLLRDSEFAICALREYIKALPDEVVAQLPAMPGIEGDWLDLLQADLKTAIAA